MWVHFIHVGYALTKEQTQQLEATQKRVIHIIFNFASDMLYISMQCYTLQIKV